MVVIIIIAILATLTIVAYSGISNKAALATIQSDLSSNSRILKLYHAQYGFYPTTLDANKCATNSLGVVDTNYCLKLSGSNTIFFYKGTSSTFSLIINRDSVGYKITESSAPVATSVQFNSASGGIITEFTSVGQTGTVTGKKYRVHTFTSTNNFNVTFAPNMFDVLVVGAGGGGAAAGGCEGWGYTNAAGGGPGGAVKEQTIPLSVSSILVTVGSGSTGSGNSSSISSVTASGGSAGDPWSSLGGIGAGGINSGRSGGPGKSTYMRGYLEYFGGGGGAGNTRDAGGAGAGGIGGGAYGGDNSWGGAGSSAAANTGGGGGGSGWRHCDQTSYPSSGGSGVVIIRYELFSE